MKLFPPPRTIAQSGVDFSLKSFGIIGGAIAGAKIALRYAPEVVTSVCMGAIRSDLSCDPIVPALKCVMFELCVGAAVSACVGYQITARISKNIFCS